MARNRQRAKQRQAERRARRLAEEGGGTDGAPSRRDELTDDPTTVDPSPAVPPELAVGAPPQDEGFSEQLVERDPVLGDRPSFERPPGSKEEALEEIEDWEVDEPEEEIAARGAGEAGYEARGRRGRADAEAHKDRPRVIQFL